MTFKLNSEQSAAVAAMKTFLKDPEAPFFLLSGSAGTGKTFSMKAFVESLKGRVVFTAPTNKATKVLRDTLTTDNYRPECRTIYSLLGLRLEANGEIKELTMPEDPLDLSQYEAIIVDEASMINKTVMNFIRKTSKEFSIKFIFMGDPAQLPPVKEDASEVWKIESKAELLKVERYDNQILDLAVRLREAVNHPAPKIKLESNFDGDEGVWKLGEGEFEAKLLQYAALGRFSTPNNAKALAWRNVTVDKLNKLIRNKIFANPVELWLPEDRIVLLEPAKDLDGETAGTTDDEGTINRVEVEYHPLYPEFKVFRLSLTTDDNRTIVLRVLHPDAQAMYAQRVEDLAAEARLNRKLWGRFWDFKDAFHKARYSYALTVHRSQGSTYETVFVDWRDILINRNRSEAFRCLYVAATRPKKRLMLN